MQANSVQKMNLLLPSLFLYADLLFLKYTKLLSVLLVKFLIRINQLYSCQEWP